MTKQSNWTKLIIEMFYDRGNAYLKLENIEKACSDWKIAIEKGDPRKARIK